MPSSYENPSGMKSGNMTLAMKSRLTSGTPRISSTLDAQNFDGRQFATPTQRLTLRDRLEAGADNFGKIRSREKDDRDLRPQ
jgi:hypothetical protein